jgi:release factor glutamine methyltransferase
VTVAQALRASGIDAREARLLLASVTGFSEASVLAHPEQSLPPAEETLFLSMAARRAAGEPVAYILGRKEFYGIELAVNPAVLIPRPETELLVELALQNDFSSVADLGTGSGAIAIALKRNKPSARVVAVEASAAALVVAKRNAARYDLEIDFRHGRWFEALAGERFDLIVSNPPYVAVGDPHLRDLGYEPQGALLAGKDGLDAIREIVHGAPAHLQAGGMLLVEHGAGQDTAVRQIFRAAGLEQATTWPDLAGIPRVSGARR